MVQQGISNYPADSSSANAMSIFRTGILLLSGILAVVNLGIVTHLTVLTEELAFVASFQVMGIISSILTFVLVPTFIIVARTRKNAWIVYTLTEIVVFGILWILWVVAAALVIQKVNVFHGDCSIFPAVDAGICHEFVAIDGLSVTIFVLLLIYVLTLIIFATVRSMSQGSGVWFQSVKELQASPSSSTMYMTTLASQTTAPGSSDTWKDKPIPDAYAGVPVTVALPSTGMGPSRSGYPAAPNASPYAEV